jgi:DNA adenine methylase
MPPDHPSDGRTATRTHPPLAYPGNKAKLADVIIDNLPAHDTYVEVFAGTAGVLFNKVPSRNEVLNDADGALYNFLNVLRDRPDDLQEWLRAQPYNERDYNEWRQRWHDGWRPRDDVVAAGIYFFLRRASFGADMGGFRATADGRRFAPRQFNNAVDRLDALSARLEDVMLLNRDFEDVMRKYADSEDAFLYMDPPYKGSLHRYKASLFDRPRFCHLLAELSGAELTPFGEHVNWMLSCATIPASIEGLPYNIIETECVHEIDSSDGAKTVTEKLVMNYDVDECPSFSPEPQARLDGDRW